MHPRRRARRRPALAGGRRGQPRRAAGPRRRGLGAARAAPGGARYAAPRDLQAGGTWIGVSAGGVLAALTNYHAPLDWYPDPARRSRGDLVRGPSTAPAAAAARAALATVDAAAWNPFHLVVADAARPSSGGTTASASGLEALGPGLHVVTEDSPHGLGPRGDLVRARWPVDPSPARLRELLASHAAAPPAPPPASTSTRTTGRARRRCCGSPRTLAHAELYVADGPPCTIPLEDRSALLAGLARSA